MPAIDERSPSATEKKGKLECKLYPQTNHTGISNLKLLFTREDFDGYLTLRAAGLSPKTITWLKKSAELLWEAAQGTVSVTTMRLLRDHVLAKYQDTDAKRKVLQILVHLSTTCQSSASTSATPNKKSSPSDSVADEIRDFAKLRDDALITNAEFADQKA